MTNYWNSFLQNHPIANQFVTQHSDVLKALGWTFLILVVAALIFFRIKRVMDFLADRAHFSRLALTPLRVLLRYGTLVVAFALVLQAWGYETKTLLAGLVTILGLVAIGFVAVWSILSNFMCTFVLIVFKPFSVGDDLDFPADSVSGKVVDVTLLWTSLRTPDGAIFQVPNNMFFQKIFKRKEGAQSIDLEHQLRQDKPAA